MLFALCILLLCGAAFTMGWYCRTLFDFSEQMARWCEEYYPVTTATISDTAYKDGYEEAVRVIGLCLDNSPLKRAILEDLEDHWLSITGQGGTHAYDWQNKRLLEDKETD